MTIAVLGTGKLGGAIVRGWRAAGVVEGDNITLPARASGHALASELGARLVATNAEAVVGAELLLVAVKPHLVVPVLTEVRDQLSQNCLVVSVAAGITTQTMAAVLPPGQPLMRVLPNTPALIRASATAFARSSTATDEHVALTVQLFSTLGLCLEVTEAQLDATIGVASSGVAFVYLFIEALTDGGVRMGLPRPVARALAAQTVIGAGQLVLETGEHPIALKDAVTTPGGTTMAGIAVLESGAFKGLVMEAVKAAADRATELGASPRA